MSDSQQRNEQWEPADRPTLSVRGLQVWYRDLQALSAVDLAFDAGRLIGIVGPNGAGKSTLIKAMLGLIPTAAGSITYRNRPLTQQLDRVAYVPQRSAIDWTYPATVWDVVLLGRVRKTGWFRPYSAASRRQATRSLARVGLLELRDRPLGELSGGQQQRVFLARALAQEAELFCFDEPFVGVDRQSEDVLFAIFRELAAAGHLIFVVNHDLGEAIAHFDDIILLNRTVVACGPRREVFNAENLTRTYGGKIRFLEESILC